MIQNFSNLQKSFIHNNYQLIHIIQSTDFAIVLRLLLLHKTFEMRTEDAYDIQRP